MFPYAGEVFSTACALLWAVGVVFFKKSGEQIAPLQLNLFKDVVGLVLFLLTLLVLGKPLWQPGATADTLVLLASGAVGIGVADTVFLASLNRLGAGRSAIVDCLYSPFIILCSFVYLDEPLGWQLFVALGLMTAAILLGSWQPERQETKRATRNIQAGVALGAFSMLLMAAAIVWVKPVLDRSDILWATTVRLAGGTALVAPLALLPGQLAATRRLFRPGRHLRHALFASLTGSYLAMFFWIAGMKYTYTTVASVLNQLSTVFTVLLAAPLLAEPLTSRRLLAVVLGFSGAAMLLIGRV